ncbi:TIGR04104 family putative zinc finger protein [Bacillus sp. es.036]|uniref:TIGR04104 family putative zinc finger protein n=1 Tax=Bacillus sp. es.036 TaxID=1761764 RepID=UPI000BF9E5E7|nr:CXXC-20-CXXC protein [Bacillus sp. es.036]
MPICQNCGYKWSWRETFVRMFTLRQKLKCPNCEGFQYLSKQSKNQLTFFTVIPFIWFPLVMFSVPYNYVLIIELIFCVISLGVAPYFYKLRNQEEPMW